MAGSAGAETGTRTGTVAGAPLQMPTTSHANRQKSVLSWYWVVEPFAWPTPPQVVAGSYPAWGQWRPMGGSLHW